MRKYSQITKRPGDVETDDDLRQRYLEVYKRNSFGGNVSQYDEEVKKLDGVGELQVYRAYPNSGHVTLSIVGPGYRKISSDLIRTLQDTIDPTVNDQQGTGLGLAPIFHIVHVTTPTEQAIPIGFSLQVENGYTVSQLKPLIEEKLEEYFSSLRKDWGVLDGMSHSYNLTVHTSRIIVALLGITGVANVSNIKINGIEGDYSLTETGELQVLPILGAGDESRDRLDIRDNLPTYYRGFREIDILAEALSYVLGELDSEYQKVLCNQFIQTADAIGIARFEKMLSITPNESDSLEARRQRVLSKMAVSSLFTYKVLETTLKEMCDNGEYKITSNLDTFFMDLKVRIGQKGMMDVLYDTLYTMLPAHIGFYIHNHLPAVTEGGTTYALATTIKKSYGIVDAVDAHNNSVLALSPGLSSSISLRKDIVDSIEDIQASELNLMPGLSTSISIMKDVVDQPRHQSYN